MTKANTNTKQGSSANRSARNKAYDQMFESSASSSKRKEQFPKKQNRKPQETQVKVSSRNRDTNTLYASSSAKALSGKQKKTVKKRKKLLVRLFRLSVAGICLVLCWCLFVYYLIIFNEQKPLAQADAGIILGAAMWNNEPSPALKERLDYAVQLYDQNLIKYFILSGGLASGSRGVSEAEGMKSYLQAKGIAEDKLLLESHSQDTYENLLFSQRVMEKNKLNSAIIISHQYHTKRAEDIARFVGYERVQTAGVETTVLNVTYHYTREMLAYSKWQLNKILSNFGIML